MSMNIVNDEVVRITKELSLSERPVIYLCNSDFSNFWSHWTKVIEKLKKIDEVKVRKRSEVFVLPIGNSDGEVSHDEICRQEKYFLTKN